MSNRGAIKYQPFDALEGYRKEINKVKSDLKKEEFPVLSDDDYESINYNLNNSLHNKVEVVIYIHVNGLRDTVYGIVRSVDLNLRVIKLEDNTRIKLDSVIGVSLS